ncbi:MAG TPA: hypothetical protein VFZ78_07660, partial [Flavisolibacter sp.]
MSSTISTNATFTNFTIKMGYASFTQFTSGPFETGLTTVYFAASQVIPSTSVDGWIPIQLQTPFSYSTSQNLIVEISQTAYSNGFSVRQDATGGNLRMYGAVTSATGTAGTGLLNFGFDLLASPCTTPPVPGTATASASTVCFSSPVTLNLTGNSAGLGQTYQWQSSTTQAGTYTDIGSSQSITSITINPTATLWYRAAVTCGGNTQYSVPVQVNVTPGFPGGTYTINSTQPTGGTNFQTFTEAAAAISCGITGPVIFNVSNGPYNEHFTIPAIGGTSSTNTVTFNGNGATLNYNSTLTGERAAITLSGADWIRINNLTINASTGTYGWGIHL